MEGISPFGWDCVWLLILFAVVVFLSWKFDK
jgi:hypothetical protein